MVPRSAKIENGFLALEFDNGFKGTIKLANMRYNCPCALCMDEKEKRGEGYIPFYGDKEIGVEKISQVGSYALAVAWKDGHNTGIYSFDYLIELIEKERKAV